MSKYFDRLVKLNEGLSHELGRPVQVIKESTGARNNFENAIAKWGGEMGEADAIIHEFDLYIQTNPDYAGKSLDDISFTEFCEWLVKEPDVVTEDDASTIPVPADQVTPEQKKDILKDRGIDQNLTKDMSPEELDGALKVSDGEQKNESEDEVSKEYIISIDDADLDVKGYVVELKNRKLETTSVQAEAMKFSSEVDANEYIGDICSMCHYDKDTMKVETFVDDVNVGIDDGESWISLDPSSPGATALP